MRISTTLPQSVLFSTLNNRLGKQSRLVLALALVAIAASAAAASFSSSTFCALLFGRSSPRRLVVAGSTGLVTKNSVTAPDILLNKARRGHTATLLADGKVLVTGGENETGFVTEAEIFDPGSGSFSVSGNLSTPRADHTATRLSDGRVLIAGGRGEPGPLSSTEIFDPTSGAFTSGPNLKSARSGQSATTLSDGRIIFAGGDASESFEIYDPQANMFTVGGANMLAPRAQHGAALLDDGRILFAGGTAPDGSPVFSGEILDVADASFTAVDNNVEDPHVRPLLRLLPDGKVQIIGGTDHEDMEIYDPVINSFGAHAHVYPIGDSHPELLQQILDAPTRAALFRPGAFSALLNRTGQTITELSGSKQALVIGGVDSSGAFLSFASTLNSSAATVTTDKLDYAPGTPVLVSGTGWQPNELVTIMFHEDPHVDTENPHTFIVQADANGNFFNQQYAPEDQDNGLTYILAGMGGTSGRTAQTAFTDTSPGSLGNYATAGLSGTTAPATVPPSNVATNVTFSTLSRGAGLAAVAATDAFNSSSWQQTSALTVAGNTDYYEFTITPSSGYKFNASELRVGLQRSGSGPDKAELRSSLDSYGSAIGSVLSVGSSLATFTINLSSVSGLQNRTSAVTFRIYGYNASASGGTLRIQRVTSPAMVGLEVDGTVAALNSGTLQFNAPNYPETEANSGTHTTTITVQRTGGSDGAVSVHYATSDGTATTADNDYDAASGDLNWADGDSADKTFTVTIHGDTTYEASETVNLILSAPTGGALLAGANPAQLTIQNDDTAPAISIDDVIHNEGNTGNTSYDFTVSLSNASYQTVMVDYATANDTATAPSDYTTVPTTTLTFLPGETSKQVTVLVNGDNVFEATETFFVNLSNQTNSTIADNQGVGTITNDDSQPAISIADKSQLEGNAGSSSFDFGVTLSNPSDQTITVHYTTADGTATQPGDYSSTSGTVTFVPGDLSETVSVSVNGDNTFEGDETFTVILDTPANATIADGTGLGTIQNDDTAPAVSIDDVTHNEANTGNTSYDFTVSLSNASYQTVMVDYATSNDTATAPSDYTTAPTTTLTFLPGETSKQVTVLVNGDNVFEATETFFVNLSNQTNSTIADNQGVGMVTNDDSQPTVQFAAASSAGSESASPVNLTVTLSAASSQTVTVNYSVNGSSTATGGGVDYTLASGTLTFNPDQMSQNISFTVNDDLLDENDETVVLDLSAAINATLASPATHAYTIQDNDAAPNFTISDVTMAEGNAGTTDFIFTVTKTGPTSLTATLNYASANGTINPATGGLTCGGAGIDYETKSGTLTFLPAETTMMVTIKVCGDITSEANETFFINLSGASNAAISDNQGVGTINNDDAAPYNFEGFFAPIDNPPTVNTVKAGSAVPVKWRLTTAGGAPVSDPGSFVGLFSYEVSCGTTDGLEAPVETVAPGGSGLQYQGNGNWQINWKTLPNYPRGSCRLMELRLNDGTSHYANFKFK